MPGPYVILGDIQQAVADRIHKPLAKLDQRWTNIINDAIAAAYRDLRVGLMNPRLGYTQAQLDMWDDRISYSKDQTLFWAFTNGAGLDGFADQDYSKLDHRKEIQDPGFVVFIAGRPAQPGVIGTDDQSVYVGQICQSSGGVNPITTFRTEADRRLLDKLGGGWAHGDDQLLEGWPG